MAEPRRRFPRLESPKKPKYVKVGIEKLEFDPDNPRFGGSATRKNPDEIQTYLEGAPHYALNLVGSIAENGFLPYEPLIVRENGDAFVVIEGNRRLAAVRAILRDPAKYPEQLTASLQEIPVLIFPGGSGEGDSEEMLRYLGVRHLFGFRDWPPASKAMFLDKRIGSKKDIDQVLKELNITRQEIARYLLPYRLTRAARKIFKKVDTEDFWSLAESFSRPNIRTYVQLDVDRKSMRIKSFSQSKLRYLTQFLYGKHRRVTDTRQLSALSRVLGSPVAAMHLEGGASLEEASLYVESKGDTIRQLIRELEKLFDKIRQLSPDATDSTKIIALASEFSRKLKK
jgi:hypothetical protein